MDVRDRRDFLKLCVASVPALAFARSLDAEQALGAEARSGGPTPQAFRTPATLDRYADPLPIPKRILPHGTRNGISQYSVRMTEFKQQLHSQLPPTRLWGYEGQYPGPIFEAHRGTPIEVQWENHLPTTHIFAIDPHIHGAMPPAPQVRTVPHLHGSRSRSESDGLPEKWFIPGQSALYQYPNDQLATTLWYHDHAMGITRLNVYAGLSGFFFLRDEVERKMGLPSGDHEIPLLLQDRTIDDQGQLVYAPTHEDAVPLPPGVWGPEFLGEIPVVNGRIFPYLDVEPTQYRLRVLNGSNSRFVNLFFNRSKSPTDIPSLIPFHQIGTDGGFLPKPAAMNKLLLGPAERADLIIDFSEFQGSVVTLTNDAAAPYPGWTALHEDRPALNEFMQFRVVLPASAKERSFSLPAAVPFSRLEENQTIATREFILSERMDDQGHSLGVRINGKGYDDPVTETVTLGSVEKWRFINTTDDAHPMHLHLVQFQILHRQGFNIPAMQSGKLELVGKLRMPADNEAGWKDTAVVNPGDVLTILVRFEGYTGRYVFHCHMLEHEDNDMMRPYEVVPVVVRRDGPATSPKVD
jgi:spore coat protein A, manganese oxidase